MSMRTLLYVEIPCEDLIRAHPDRKDVHTLKRHWHEHINFFTRAGLAALLERCGLGVAEVRTIETEGGGKPWHVFSVACRLLDPRATPVAPHAFA
jgi:hypothetical protein